MDNLIQLTNKLQTVLASISSYETLDLPQIVVVGSQSSGKSSVLETIVQRDFLPRGSGIVTRRPLILQLVTLREPDAIEYGEFLHVKDKKYYNFDEIRQEIEHETNRVAGENKGISRLPIHLRIHSPNVLTLTLVDLPGLTKIPIGNQPSDIEKQIRSLVMDYISNPNSIVLAVSPANMDVANSDSLKLARMVDPQGKRTIGVLTKLDLMDAGTNALDVLLGRSYPLKLGFVGVVNRSQQDILTNKPMAEAIKAETAFFMQHPAYRGIASQCGTQHLSRKLNAILLACIKEKLPDLRSKLSSLVSQTQQELAQFGNPAFSSGAAHRGTLVLKLITQFSNNFVSAIDGTSSEISVKELCGGARIYYIFNNIFGNALDAIVPCANLTNNDIRTAIRNSTGPRPSLFVPEHAFDLLVRPQIKLLESPSLRCVDLVYEELVKICHMSKNKELQRYPRLLTKLVEEVSELLRERLSPTTQYVQSLIDIERAYINTNHPDFLGAAGAMANIEIESRKKKKLDKRNKIIHRDSSASTVISVGSRAEEDGLAMFGGKSKQNGAGLATASNDANQKESFLTYFFGGANKAERQALGPQDALNNAPFTTPVSISHMMEAGIEQKLEQVSLSPTEGLLQITDREELEIQLIRTLITNYFAIIRKNIQDLVPKAIMHLLVNHSRESIQNRLVTTLYKEELFDELVQEDEAVAADREKCKAMLDVYKQAFDIVNQAL